MVIKKRGKRKKKKGVKRRRERRTKAKRMRHLPGRSVRTKRNTKSISDIRRKNLKMRTVGMKRGQAIVRQRKVMTQGSPLGMRTLMRKTVRKNRRHMTAMKARNKMRAKRKKTKVVTKE